MLVLSFSDISNDARVLKQLTLFSDEWEVTTCGYGPKPDLSHEHLRIPEASRSLNLDGRLITLRQYRLAYWSLPAVRAAMKLLRGRRGQFDVVLANEPEAAPVALKLRPKFGIHADLHEYTPSLQEHQPAWNRRIRPFYEWLIRSYAARADSWTSPSEGVSRKHKEMFGFLPTTVTNAAPYWDLKPTEVHSPIRFVHHGGAQRNRDPATMVQGFMDSSVNGTFDLFLTGIDPVVREEVREQAATDPRVTVHDGIPYDQLIPTLNDYDVGLFLLPPQTFNYRWALPNKLFDFVQARLGQIVSPNPEMAETIREHGVGTVTDGFAAENLTAVLNKVTPGDVAAWKQTAHAKAKELSADQQTPKWKSAVSALAQKKLKL